MLPFSLQSTNNCFVWKITLCCRWKQKFHHISLTFEIQAKNVAITWDTTCPTPLTEVRSVCDCGTELTFSPQGHWLYSRSMNDISPRHTDTWHVRALPENGVIMIMQLRLHSLLAPPTLTAYCRPRQSIHESSQCRGVECCVKVLERAGGGGGGWGWINGCLVITAHTWSPCDAMWDVGTRMRPATAYEHAHEHEGIRTVRKSFVNLRRKCRQKNCQRTL